MDYGGIETLREKHPSWRLLRAGNAALVLSFLGEFFVDGNRGASSANTVAAALDERLDELNAISTQEAGEARFPKNARAYLDDWSAAETAYLRRFYPSRDDEVHYEATPALEKAYGWVQSLRVRPFVATESRLHTAVELLRQIVQGTDTDPERRIAALERRRDDIDAEIELIKAGEMPLLRPTGVRDRYQQFSSTARELLSDFREVEENFRGLDRLARERIATWDGAKGDLLAQLVGDRSDIAESDQGHSFQAFYEYLLSESRQHELAELLKRVSALDELEIDHRASLIHHDWSEAAERAQRTVRQISEQLRRFLDDNVWLENRRVLDLVRRVEAVAIDVRDAPPEIGLEVDEPGVAIALPFERPLYRPPSDAAVESLIPPAHEDADAAPLFFQAFIDQAKLLDNIRATLPESSEALLSDIISMHPIEQGAAEIVSYLAIDEADVDIEFDDGDQTVLDYSDPEDEARTKRATLPRVTVRRR